MSTRGIIAGVTAASVALVGVVAVSTAQASSAASHAQVRGVSADRHADRVVDRRAASRPARRSAVDVRSFVDKPLMRHAALSRAQAQQRYAAFTLRSPRTRDMRGVEGSLYRGRYFRASVEPLRKCIATRESEGHYDVVSPSGLYFGAYQVSRPLARGATWMMLREHRALMGAAEARRVLAHLRSLPMNRWPRYWQDAAFHTVMNWDHARSGAEHWAGGRWHC